VEAAVELTQMTQDLGLEEFSKSATIEQQYRGKEKVVSLFGKLDATSVNDDPFWIEPNTYHCVCIDAVIRELDDGSNALSLSWQIDEPASDFHEKRISDFFGLVDPDVEWEDLDSRQKDKVKYLKRRLRRAFGVSESELNTVKPSELIGKEAYLEVVERKGAKGTANEGKTFTNIRDAMNPQLWEDEGHTRDTAASSSLGL
jgi:hypothetical protein